MATSYKYYKENIRDYLKNKFPEDATVLDVGAGEGTYYNYLGDYFKKMDAVEVFKPNIVNYELEKKYHKVYHANIDGFEYDFYDIIIFGDVIEHLEVKEAQEVLKYAYDRCEEMIVALPYRFEQDIVEDNIYEIHKQPDLTPENVLERYPMLKLLIGNEEYGYYVKDESYGK